MDHIRLTDQQLREKRAQQLKTKLLATAAIPKVFADIAMPDLVTVPARIKTALSNYVKKFGILEVPGLYLCSAGTGTGKTALAICVMKELIASGGVQSLVSFIDYSDLIASARRAHNSDSDYLRSEVVSKALASELLIIDEFAMLKTTEFVSDFLRWFINQLWTQKKAIILTSNIALSEDLVEKLSFTTSQGGIDAHGAHAIVSRLFALCNLIEVNTQEDYRTR